MPAVSTTARRLRAYQATLDRRARPARPTTASRRCAPTGDGTLHALLTVLAYYWYHWYPILPYFYTVIGSIDLLASSDSPVYLHPSAVFFYPVYLTMNYATLRPLLSTCYSKKILSVTLLSSSQVAKAPYCALLSAQPRPAAGRATSWPGPPCDRPPQSASVEEVSRLA